MAHKTEIILLAVVAVIAIIGLILMLQYASTGFGVYGGSLYPGRAVEKIAEERFFKGGNPEGVVVDVQPRTGYRPYMGMTECPENYRPTSRSQYISKLDYYKEICVPSLFPDAYPGIMCCPSTFSVR